MIERQFFWLVEIVNACTSKSKRERRKKILRIFHWKNRKKWKWKEGKFHFPNYILNKSKYACT